jgi:hypothetical protein
MYDGAENEEGRPRPRPQPTPVGVPPFAKGLLTGLVLANLNKQLLLGTLLGTAAGMYAQQEYGLPDVKETFGRIRKAVLDTIDKGRSS